MLSKPTLFCLNNTGDPLLINIINEVMSSMGDKKMNKTNPIALLIIFEFDVVQIFLKIYILTNLC